MEDKIILKFKTKNIINFYEIEPSTANSRSFAKLECDLYAQFWRSLWRDFAHLKVRSWRCIILLWTQKYNFLPYFLNYLEKKAGTPI